MIKALLFDLGNVVIPFDFKLAYRSLAEHCGLQPEEIPARIRATGLIAPFERGEIEPESFAREFSSALGLKLEYQEFCDWWGCAFLPGTLVPEELLADLAGRYRLLALSNTNAIHFPLLERNYPVLRRFDDLVLSYRVGAAKPEARIYREAIARAQCAAGECLFIDDMAVNVEAAREHGIDAVQFLSAEQLNGELRARGIKQF